MNRSETYLQLSTRLNSMKIHAQRKGDGVQVDKLRKVMLDVQRLKRNDETPLDKECV